MNSWMTTVQWVFSGIGVLVAGWLATWAYRRFSKHRGQQVLSSQVISHSSIAGSVAGRDVNVTLYGGESDAKESADDYRELPSPAAIQESISKVSIYARESLANTYEGLRVRWSGSLYNIYGEKGGEIDVVLKIGETGSLVVTKVRLSDYPILKTVRGHEPVVVMGIIDYVQPNGMVHLKDAKLRFL
jgi:hypothetical protein